MTWEKRLLRARKTGVFSFVDKKKVDAWPTCAIGEKFKIKGIKGIGLPKYASDGEILVWDFMDAVKADKVYEAVRLYDKIQRLK